MVVLQVSMDDDVEDIFEGKRCCDREKEKSVSLPAGALAVLAKDARQRMMHIYGL